MSCLIYEDEYIKAFHSPQASSFTICTFAHLNYPLNQTTFWGQRRFESLEIDCIGVVAKSNNWYPADAMNKVALQLKSFLVKPLVLYGHSMGGYAAIKYGRLLGAIGTIASSPMTTIDPMVIPDDRRYHQFFDPISNKDMDITAEDISGRIIVVYDRFELWDRIHVERLHDSAPNASIQEIHADFFSHEAVQVMIEVFTLSTALGQIFHGISRPEIAAHIRKTKKTNPKYLINLAQYVANRSRAPLGKERMIRSILTKIDNIEINKVEWFVHVLKAQILSAIEARRRNIGTAIDHLLRALEIERQATGLLEPNMRLALASLWMEFGCPLQAIELLQKLLHEGHCEQAASRYLDLARLNLRDLTTNA